VSGLAASPPAGLRNMDEMEISRWERDIPHTILNIVPAFASSRVLAISPKTYAYTVAAEHDCEFQPGLQFDELIRNLGNIPWLLIPGPLTGTTATVCTWEAIWRISGRAMMAIWVSPANCKDVNRNCYYSALAGAHVNGQSSASSLALTVRAR
jgi:hypothetical protein